MNAALRLIQEQGLVRPRDLAARAIPPDYLDRLYRRGLVDRVARGFDARPKAEISEHHSLAEPARQVPRGVVCLLPALRFHGLTTQLPHEVWLAWSPRTAYPRLRVFRFSGLALTELVERHRIEGVEVSVYTAAKIVADCFKFRNKVGLDVALEALRDCWRGRRATMDQLWAAAVVPPGAIQVDQHRQRPGPGGDWWS